MRKRGLFFGDLRRMYKYGFFILYFIFTMLYIGLLSALPESWREKAGILMILTDPAALGLFFMGAIVLFEKNERVLDSVAVSPVKPIEYVLSKLVSIAVISTASAAAIGLFSGLITNAAAFLYSVFLSSCVFSAVGLIAASRAASLNGFILVTIPAEILIFIPAVLRLFGYGGSLLLLHPGVCMVELCQNGGHRIIGAVSLAFWAALLVFFARAAVVKMFKTLGGVKL